MRSTNQILSLFTVFFLLGSFNLFSQSSPDCVTAPNMCGNSTINFVSSSGSGSFVDYSTSTTISNPQTSPAGIVPPGGSGCHLAGELNPNFFIITCQTPGTLEFSIADGPGVQMGCYDWVMWPYTATTCSGISGNTLPPTRCCWNSACSGGTGIASTANIPAGGSANNYCTPVNVNCGDKFIICISNYSGVNATVPVKFIGTSVVSCAATTGTPLAVNNATICSGGTATLIITGGTSATTATWTPGPTVTNTLIVSPSTTTTYTATKPGGCGTGTITATVSVVPTPTAVANNNSPVCAGASFTLFGGGVGTYSWSGPGGYTSTLQNPVLTNVTTAMSGVYTLTVSNGNCKSTATTSVTVNPNPIPAAANTGPYCPGQTIQLSVGAFSTYTWTGPSAFSSNAQNPTLANAQTTNSGVYTVSITNAQGCKGTATTNVVVNPKPTVNMGSNSPLCAGNTLNLTSTGGGTYSWSGPNVFSSALQNPSVANVTSANTGIYTVTVTTLGCTNTGTISVTVTTPTSTAANTGPYCAGQTINLTTPAATTYTWSGPSGFASNLQNPSIANSTTVMSGIYTVSATTGGCSSTATTNVVVNSLPTPVAANTGPYCPGNTISLSVSAFNSYTWTGPGSYGSNGQNPNISNAQTTNGGVYTVSVTNAQGCVASAATNVVVNPNPIVNVNSNSPVCINTNINLTSTGGGTYNWSGPNAFSSANQNPTVANAAIINAGVYSVTVTALGCTSTGSVNVVVTTPTVAAANPGPFCAGTTMTLTSTTASTFTWTGPGGFNSSFQNPTQNNVTVGATGTYTVIVSIGTCTASATTNVLINALPTPTAQSNSPVCAGQTINLTGLGGTTYTWTGPSFNSNSATPSIANATSSNGGNYILTVKDNNGCVNSANVNVVVNSLPVIAVSNPTNCVNTTINLTSNGGVTYSWSGPNSFTSNVQNPNIPSAQLNMSGVYVVTVTDANNCVNTANANVSVLPLPSPNIMSNSPVCSGGTLTLQGSGGANYAWSGPGYTGPNQNPVINNVSTGASGVYTLLVTSGTCTASTTYTVVVNPLPVFNFSNNNVLCNSQSNGTSTINVTVGTSPYNYQWSNGQNTQVANGLNAGTYTCIVTDANNCSSLATTQISQPTPFTVTINSATYSACAGTPINVTANGSGGTGPYTYNWVSGPSTGLYSVNEVLAGSYSYTVDAVDAYNCPASNFVNLTFFPQPTVTATSATVCAGTATAITASGATNYIWQPGNISGPTYPFSGNTSVNVTVTGTSNGCSNSANASVVVSPIPSANFTTSGDKACVPACVTFNGSGSSSIIAYGWTINGIGVGSGNASETHCFDEASTYSVGLTVIDNNGCTSTAPPMTIDIYPQPVADFNHAPIKPIVNIDQEVTFTDASWGTPIVSWNWYFMNTAQYTSVLQNPTFAYTEPGTYAVALVVKSDKGCMDTLIRPIEVGEDFGIYVPNAFTPNGDGLNDLFNPKGFGIVKYELNIYDRWGELMFHTTTFEEGWNGARQKKKDVSYPLIIEEGVYTWLINCTSVFGKSHELKGHVTLIK
jgi:gliding motility-associated-like protein